MESEKQDFPVNFKFEFRITVGYLIFGFMWILFSDKLLEFILTDNNLITEFQTLKGIFFIIVTAAFLYLFAKKHMYNLSVAESKRIESENHYKALFFDNRSIILLINPENGKIEDANPSACLYYGWTHSEICEKSIYEINTLTVEQINNRIKDAISAKQNHFELRHRLANGEIRDVEVFSGPIHFENKTLMYSHIHDITEQKISREIIRKNEERYRNTLDHLLEGCQIIGYNWKYLYLNKSAETHNHRPNSELIGQRYMDMWPGIEKTEVFGSIKRSLEKRESFHFEYKFIYPNGNSAWFDLSIQPVPEGVFLLSIDITERRKAEQELLESEEKYRLIADNSDDWIYWVKPNGQLKYISPASEHITGYTVEEFYQHPELILNIVTDSDSDIVAQHTKISKEDDNAHILEFRIVTKNNELRWISHTCSALYSPDGEYLGRRATNHDITERKRSEEQLFESEFRFRNLFENGPFGMVIASREFRFNHVNPTFCKILGYTEEELLKLTFKDVTHPDDLKYDLVNIEKLYNREIDVYKTEKRYIRKDGETIWGSLTVTPNYDIEGQFLYNLGIIEDITRRKQAESNLVESENRYRSLFENMTSGFVLFEVVQNEKGIPVDLIILAANKGFETTTGLKLSETIGKQLTLVLPGIENDSAGWIETYANVAITGTPHQFEQGSELLGVFYTVTAYKSGPNQCAVTFIDITERKIAEEVQRESEKRLEHVLEGSQLGFWDWNIQTGTVIRNNRWAEMLGYTLQEIELNVKQWSDLQHPDDKSVAWKSLNDHLEGRTEAHRVEYRMRTKDGQYKWILDQARIVERDPQGHPQRMSGTHTDISERKQAEEKIRELNERIETATKAAQVGIWDWDISNNHLLWNDQMYILYGVKNEEFTGAIEAWYNGLHPDDKEFAINQTQLALIGEKDYDTEFRIVWPNGTIRNCKAKGKVFRNDKGEAVRMMGVNYDITEQKRIDQKMREKDQEFRKLSANVPDLIYQFTRKTDGSYCVPIASKGIWNIFGCTPEEVVDDFSPIGRVIYPDDVERVINDIEYSAEHLTYFTCEFRVQIPGRDIQWIYSKSTPEKLPDGSITWYGFNTDITQQKKVEEILKLSEERYRNIFESAVIGIYRTTPEGKIIMANPTLIKMLGFDSFEDLTHRNLEHEGFESNETRKKFKSEIEKNKRILGLESVWKTKDGRSVVVNENAQGFYDSNGNLKYYEGTIEDITQRKKMENTLRESEEKFRKAFFTNPDAITINRFDTGLYVSVNEGFMEIFGYSEEEVLGKTSLELNIWYNPGDRIKFVNQLRKHGFVDNFETKFRSKNGEVKDTLMSSVIIELENIPHILSTTKDITARKQIEEALKYNESLLREVGRIAHVGGWEYNIVTNKSRWTEEVARIHDLDPKIPASTSLSLSFYAEKSKPIIEKAFNDAMNKAIPYDLELQIISATGKEKWIRTIGHPVTINKKVVKVQGSFQDITELKKAELAIRESEEKFRSLMESIPLPVVYSNSKGEVIFSNNRFEEVFGYTPSDLPGINEWWLLAYPDADYRLEVMQNWTMAVENAAKTGTDIESDEYRITCKDGTVRTIIISGLLINDNLLATFIDITDRKKAEEEVIKLNENLEQRVEDRTRQLKEANQELEAFSYSVSHDLRAPLRHINGFIDLLANNYTDQLPEKGKHYFDVIVNSTQQMGALIDDLLQFSRTGRQEMQKINLNMNEVLQEVFNISKNDTVNRNIEWKIATLPVVFGDSALLRLVWYNLLNNAVKFTNAKNPAIIEIGYREEAQEFVFFIRDNGAGFDMKYAHKLFGVFQRLHSKREFDGTGIGLANVRRIILRHGGRTWADAQPDKGAVFYFTIPKTMEE